MIDDKGRVGFSATELAAMLVAYAASLGITPQQFGKVLHVFINTPNAVNLAFKQVYSELGRIASEMTVEEETKPIEIIIPGA